MARPTKTYRMQIPAVICCDIDATSKREAKDKAYDLAMRLRWDGCDLPDVEWENAPALVGAVAYTNRGAAAKVLNIHTKEPE